VTLVDADVRWLLDRAQIRELTARYNRCFDDGDPDGFAATFTEDGAMEVDATVEVDGDHAVQDVKLLVLARPAADAAPDVRRTKVTNSGRYHDELVRTPDGWRFTHRTAFLDSGVGGS
jgi:hypothetical protein